MRKTVLLVGILTLGLVAVSCSGDDGEERPPLSAQEFYSQNAKAWGMYVSKAAARLENDANALYQEWNDNYGDKLKEHDKAATTCSTAHDGVALLLRGCIMKADAIAACKAVNKSESVYARLWLNDYKDNVRSMMNVLLGTCLPDTATVDTGIVGMAAPTSIYAICCDSRNNILKVAIQEIMENMIQAWDAIDGMRSYDEKSDDLNQACNDMKKNINLVLNNDMLSFLSDEECDSIVKRFVDDVALPSFRALKTRCTDLSDRASDLKKSPSNETFAKAAVAWTAAHQQWERTEAFAFGPVVVLAADAGMDTNPVNEANINQMILSQKWDLINSNAGVRGFHALEYLLFLNGEPRDVR